MGVFEVQTSQGTFEVEAPDFDAATAALGVAPAAPAAPAPAQFTSTPGYSFRQAREGPPPVSGYETAVRGAGQGALAGFGDEARALMEAGGLRENQDPIRALGVGAYKYWTGDPEAERAYNESVQAQRERNKQAQRERPGTFLASELGGAATTIPLGGGAARGAGLAAQVGQGAKVGALYGAASGAGAGEGAEDRLTRGALGGAVGGVVGGAVPPVAQGLTSAASWAARPFTQALRGFINPEAEAARRIGIALERDAAAGTQRGLTPAEEAAARAAGYPVANIDAGGTAVGSVARSAANTSPVARNLLETLNAERVAPPAVAERAADLVRRETTAGDTAATRAALEANYRATASPAYQQAYAQGARPIWTPQIDNLLGSQQLMPALREAGRKLDTAERAGLTQGPLLVNGRPTLEVHDAIKREIDTLVTQAQRSGDAPTVRLLSALRDQYVQQLDRAVPSYAAARGGAAAYFGERDAIALGERFVTDLKNGQQIAQTFRGLAPNEADQFAHGYASAIVQQIQRNPNWLRKAAENPDQRARMELVFGPNWRNVLDTHARVEGVMRQLGVALAGPTTARQLVELGLAGGGAGTSWITGDPTYAALGIGGALARYGAGRINQNVAEQVGRLLASNDPALRQQAVQIVANNAALGDAFRQLAAGLAVRGAVPAATEPSRPEPARPSVVPRARAEELPPTFAPAAAAPAAAPGRRSELPAGAQFSQADLTPRLSREQDPRGLEGYIRQRAAAYGIDPNVAVRVAQSEGLRKFSGDGGRSGGAFQLFTGGGLGNEFQQRTGLNPLDPANERATIDFALAHAARNGWGPWYGAKEIGVTGFAGIGGAAPSRTASLLSQLNPISSAAAADNPPIPEPPATEPAPSAPAEEGYTPGGPLRITVRPRAPEPPTLDEFTARGIPEGVPAGTPSVPAAAPGVPAAAPSAPAGVAPASREEVLTGPGMPHNWNESAARSNLTPAQNANLGAIVGIPGATTPEVYHRLASPDTRPADLMRAKSAMGPAAWREFSGAKIRSLGRRFPEDPFDPAAFAEAWRLTAPGFKGLLTEEHREAINTAIANGGLERLTLLAGSGPDVVRWLSEPTKASAVATWTKRARAADLAAPEAGSRIQEQADRVLNEQLLAEQAREAAAKRLRSQTVGKTVAPDVERRMGQGAIKGVESLIGADIVRKMNEGAYTHTPAVPGQWSDEDEIKQQMLDQQYRKDIGKASLGYAGVGSTIAMVGGAKGAVGRFFGGSPLRGGTPEPPGVQFGIFGGRGAKTADLNALARAEQMAAQGATKEEILAATGWHRDAAGDWKFEISDEAAAMIGKPQRAVPVKPRQMKPLEEMLSDLNETTRLLKPQKVGDRVHHPELYAAYPHLRDDVLFKDFKPKTTGGLGYYREKQDVGGIIVPEEIGVADRAAHRKVSAAMGEKFTPLGSTLHELDHAVQRYERFQMGASQKTPEVLAAAQQLQNEFIDEARRLTDAYLKAEQAWIKAQRKRGMAGGSDDELKFAFQQHMEQTDPQTFARTVAMNKAARDPELRTVMQQEAYLRMAGETEARNVAARQPMSAAERRAVPPWATQEYPYEQQLLLLGQGGRSIGQLPRIEHRVGPPGRPPTVEEAITPVGQPTGREGLGKLSPYRTMPEVPSLRGVPVEDAVKIARREPHLIPTNAAGEGAYVGAPRDIKNRADLIRMRKNFDKFVAQNVEGSDWYDRYRAAVTRMTGGEPAAQTWAARQHGQWSAGVSPEAELGFVLRENNAMIAGQPVKAGRPASHEAFLRAVEQNDPRQLARGKKTGEYAWRIDPGNVAQVRTATGVNDFRHQANLGYRNPDGSTPSSGNHLGGDTIHKFMDYETALAVDRANRKRLGGRSDWTGEQLQAAPWVLQKTYALMSRNPKLSFEDAFRRANTQVGDFFDKHTLEVVHERIPGDVTGHRPGLQQGPEAAKDTYSRAATWATAPGGRDALYAAMRHPEAPGVAMRIQPTTPAQGLWVGSTGKLESNLAEVGRPLVAIQSLKGGTKQIAPQDRQIAELAEFTRAMLDAQAAQGGTLALPSKAGLMGSINFPMTGPLSREQAVRLREVSGRYGLPDLTDRGTGFVMTEFGGTPSGAAAGKILKKGKLEEEVRGIVPEAGAPRRTYLDTSVYQDLSDLWAKGHGSGAVVTEWLGKVDAMPQLRRALNQDARIPEGALARWRLDEAARGQDVLREDLQNLRKIIGEGPGWIDRVEQALKTGAVALPAVALFLKASTDEAHERRL
jgi:Large polyvalent protein associated domain 23